MLEINAEILDRIKRMYPNRDVRDHIWGKKRKLASWNRYVQIPTMINDEYLHYEFIGGKIELHFENDDQNDYSKKYSDLLNDLISNTENKIDLSWEEWWGGYRCQCLKEINDGNFEYVVREFVDIFDVLIKNQSHMDKIERKTEKLSRSEDEEMKMQTEMVEIYTRTLEQILKLPLAIPFYQRIYCWEEQNVKCLLNDLYNHLNKGNDTTYRLGTIILHKYENKYNIIDGQQRIVTLALLLEKLGITANIIISERFESLESQQYIAYNKYLIERFCSKYSIPLENLLKKIDFSVLVLNDSSSLDLAYTFFSNQNSRGVALTDYDLLKAHHLRYVTIEVQAQNVAEHWDKMIEDGRKETEKGYERTLDIYLYRLRRWMRKMECEIEPRNYHIKREYESSAVIDEIPAFCEKFYFNEPIQGGTHFFSFVEQHLGKFRQFAQTQEYIILHDIMNVRGKSHYLYRDVIEGCLFAYYLKFSDSYLSDAMAVIMRCIVQHRYDVKKLSHKSVLQYVDNTGLTLMIDRATSPTFFLAEARDLAKDMFYPQIKDLSPIQKDMRRVVKEISKELEPRLFVDYFKHYLIK